MNHLLVFYVRTLRLVEPGAEVIPMAAKGVWDALDDQERAELLANAATDRLGTPRERPGDQSVQLCVDEQAMFRLISYGLVTENGRKGEPLLTPEGAAVAEWAEEHSPASASSVGDDVGAEQPRTT